MRKRGELKESLYLLLQKSTNLSKCKGDENSKTVKIQQTNQGDDKQGRRETQVKAIRDQGTADRKKNKCNTEKKTRK